MTIPPSFQDSFRWENRIKQCVPAKKPLNRKRWFRVHGKFELRRDSQACNTANTTGNASPRPCPISRQFEQEKKKNGGVGPFLRTPLLSNHFTRFATKAPFTFFSLFLPFYKPASSCNPVRESPLQLSGRPHCLTNRGSTQGKGEEKEHN